MFQNPFDPPEAQPPMTGARLELIAPERRAFVASMLAASAAGLLAGCSLWPTTPTPSSVRHVLDARPKGVPSTRRDLVIAVRPPRAAPGYETSAILYVQERHVLDRYATHEWAEPPARMLGSLLARSLEDAGGFSAVAQDAGGLPVDLRLDTEIVLLRQNFLTRPSVVEFALRVQLIDVSRRRMLAARYIELAERTMSDDAAGGVAAANVAVEHALAEVVSFCASAAAEMQPSRPPSR